MSEVQQRVVDYAKNYPLVQNDSPYLGPVSVGNLGQFNGRTIINLCLRTTKSSPKNASISFPSDWTKSTRFKPGDQVNVQIENGFIRNIWPAKPESVHAFKSGTVTESVKDSETQSIEATEPTDKVGSIQSDDRPY